MFETIMSWIYPNVWLSIILYYLPLVICVIGYSQRVHEDIRTDIENRSEALKNLQEGKLDYYTPKVTYGSILGYAFVSIIPIANLWAALFDVSPHLFSKLIKWFKEFFDTPIIFDVTQERREIFLKERDEKYKKDREKNFE